MTGAADPLQRDRYRARRADLADKIHGTDIDSKLQGRSCDNRCQLAIFQLLFGFKTQPARKTAMVGKNGSFPQPFGKMMGYTFCMTPGVYKHERRAVSQDQFRKTI